MSDLLSSSFRSLIAFRVIAPLLYTHRNRVISLEMYLPAGNDTYLLVNPRLIDISAEDFSDIKNSVGQSLLGSHTFFYCFLNVF